MLIRVLQLGCAQQHSVVIVVLVVAIAVINKQFG